MSARLGRFTPSVSVTSTRRPPGTACAGKSLRRIRQVRRRQQIEHVGGEQTVKAGAGVGQPACIAQTNRCPGAGTGEPEHHRRHVECRRQPRPVRRQPRCGTCSLPVPTPTFSTRRTGVGANKSNARALARPVEAPGPILIRTQAIIVAPGRFARDGVLDHRSPPEAGRPAYTCPRTLPISGSGV